MSTNRQRDKAPKVKPAKVTFYWNPQTEQQLEQLRVALLTKHQRKLTRSEIAEALVKIGLKQEKILDRLAEME